MRLPVLESVAWLFRCVCWIVRYKVGCGFTDFHTKRLRELCLFEKLSEELPVPYIAVPTHHNLGFQLITKWGSNSSCLGFQLIMRKSANPHDAVDRERFQLIMQGSLSPKVVGFQLIIAKPCHLIYLICQPRVRQVCRRSRLERAGRGLLD